MFTLAIHGGAGTLSPSEMTPEKEAAYRRGLEDALQAGLAVLSGNGSALDAVEKAVNSLEDNELFNAGRGAALTSDGRQEMDASIMCGRTGKAGAVAGVKNVRNPITLSRLVMEKTDYIFLLGDGAEEFAREQQLPFEPDAYYITEFRKEELRKAQQKPAGVGKGTVGAVALDRHGNLAAATSTGGTTNKRYGRVGDSPIIGAGTYADNRIGAISCTGDGEYFIRLVAAYDVACLMDYKGLSLAEACRTVIFDKLKPLGGEGGLIAVDPAGNAELVYHSEGMYRGWADERGRKEVAIFDR
ncbi:isoaspartyl peptidase/L-asparaginase family protein [Larkinella soli]|uniref:isoaspartyl peptidase/L-asparaginase family protein n=1 Tax=Larkinella soli TaxID=1770527 RepID=UPI000FFB85F7|nr:isoaspartyl peptidase/L-asparaginase [Larkinella soli]